MRGGKQEGEGASCFGPTGNTKYPFLGLVLFVSYYHFNRSHNQLFYH